MEGTGPSTKMVTTWLQDKKDAYSAKNKEKAMGKTWGAGACENAIGGLQWAAKNLGLRLDGVDFSVAKALGKDQVRELGKPVSKATPWRRHHLECLEQVSVGQVLSASLCDRYFASTLLLMTWGVRRFREMNRYTIASLMALCRGEQASCWREKNSLYKNRPIQIAVGEFVHAEWLSGIPALCPLAEDDDHLVPKVSGDFQSWHPDNQAGPLSTKEAIAWTRRLFRLPEFWGRFDDQELKKLCRIHSAKRTIPAALALAGQGGAVIRDATGHSGEAQARDYAETFGQSQMRAREHASGVFAAQPSCLA